MTNNNCLNINKKQIKYYFKIKNKRFKKVKYKYKIN